MLNLQFLSKISSNFNCIEPNESFVITRCGTTNTYLNRRRQKAFTTRDEFLERKSDVKKVVLSSYSVLLVVSLLDLWWKW